MTVIFDCNIYISLVIKQQIDLIPRFKQAGFNIASCDELISELESVLRRAKFRRYLPISSINNILQLIQITTASFQIFGVPNVVSDTKDNYLFALCKESKADYFITGDKLLLAVKVYQQTKIISLADFKSLVS